MEENVNKKIKEYMVTIFDCQVYLNHDKYYLRPAIVHFLYCHKSSHYNTLLYTSNKIHLTVVC